MHPVLAIPELLVLILDYLSGRSQLHFGLTCKDIWDVAVSKLWNTIGAQDTLKFVVLLPPPSDGSIDPNGRPAPRQWTRFLFYSRHIRRLTLNHVFRHRDPTLLVEDILSYDGTFSSVFPRLKYLHLEFLRHQELSHCKPFLDLDLQHLSVKAVENRHRGPAHGAYGTPFLDSISSLIRKRIPSFHIELCSVLDTGFMIPFMESEINSLIRNAEDCNSFALWSGSCTGRQLQLLAGLETVVQLGFRFSPCMIATVGNGFTLQPGAFPALTSLHLDGTPFSSMSPRLVISAVSSPHLASLKMTTFCLSHVLDVLPIAGSKWSDTLKHVTIHLAESRQGEKEQFDTSDLRALLPCRALESLIFSGWAAFRSTDDDAIALVMAWPKLRTLKLMDAYWSEPMATPWRTMKIFENFALHCPMLQELAIGVDFDADVQIEHQELSSHLTFLDVGRRSCKRPDSVIRFIRSAFPRLEVFKFKVALYEAMQSSLDGDTGRRPHGMDEVRRGLGLNRAQRVVTS